MYVYSAAHGYLHGSLAIPAEKPYVIARAKERVKTARKRVARKLRKSQ